MDGNYRKERESPEAGILPTELLTLSQGPKYSRDSSLRTTQNLAASESKIFAPWFAALILKTRGAGISERPCQKGHYNAAGSARRRRLNLDAPLKQEFARPLASVSQPELLSRILEDERDRFRWGVCQKHLVNITRVDGGFR